MSQPRGPVRTPSRFLVQTFFASVVLATGLRAQFSATGQFAPPSAPPPYEYDDVYGEFVNYETELIDPICYDEDHDLVIVANEADNRVVFLEFDEINDDLIIVAETAVGQGPASLALNPSADEVWVSLRHQSCVVVLSTVSFEITHLLRPDLDPLGVGAGNASTPGGIGFADGKAYVAASFSDQVLVYEADTKVYLGAIELDEDHNERDVHLNDPYGVAVHDGMVYVISHLSGNNTTSRNKDGKDLDDFSTTGVSDLGPDDIVIVDLNQPEFDPLSLPDFDIAVIDPEASNDPGSGQMPYGDVTQMITGVGTVLFGIASNGATNRLLISNHHSRNAEFVGESAFPEGRVVINRLSVLDPSTGSVSLFDDQDLEQLGPGGDVNIVMPTDIEVSQSGRLFVAGYGSSNIGVWDSGQNFEGALDVAPGPRGLALSELSSRLYCYSRAANIVTCFDATQTPPTLLATESLPDPTPEDVKQGRIEFLKPNSGAMTTSCASCHVDGRLDGIAWNLSALLEPTGEGEEPEFRDHKGVMVTQTLLGLEGEAPYHWRGEQKDIDDFRGAFVNLLKGELPDPADFELMKKYILSLRFPPNPNQRMNRVFTQKALNGAARFFPGPPNATLCSRCHEAPLGTNADITDTLIGDGNAGPSVTKTAKLRGLWMRLSDRADIDPDSETVENVNVLGYGVLHEGVFDDLGTFLDRFFPPLDGPVKIAQVVAFVDEFDTSSAPAVSFAEILDDETAKTPRADSIEEFLLVQALNEYCEVAGRGRIEMFGVWKDIGLYFDPANQEFVTDDPNLGPYAFSDLEDLADQGKLSVVVLGTPLGSGERIGIDRDRDGVPDNAESLQGLDPRNPDTDGDGLWDGFDDDPLDPFNSQNALAPKFVMNSERIVYATTNAIKITYRTDQPAPTMIRFWEEGNPLTVYETGDGTQPVGAGTSNVWKRHHTAFLRPAPLDDDPLLLLKPDTEYRYEIVTLGQNGQSATFSPTNDKKFTDANLADDTWRASEINWTQRQGVQNINNNQWTFTYSVEVKLEVTQGAVDLQNEEIPGRFTVYDSNGQPRLANLSSTVSGDIASFTYVTTGYQVPGDRVTFDLPMWLRVPDENGDVVPFGGQWSDGPRFLETTAP